MKLLITDIFGCRDKAKVSYLNNGYDVMNDFAKFENSCLITSIIIPSFMTVGSQMSELDQGGFFAPPYKPSSQTTPYKIGLN